MSPAIDGNKPVKSIENADLKPEQRKKARKRREIQRRHVITMPDDFAYYLREHMAEFGTVNVAQAVRILALEGLHQRGVTSVLVRAEYKAYLAVKAQAEAEEARAEAEAATGIAS